jgi:hypothetical protein
MSRKSRFMKLPVAIGAALAIVLLTGAAGPDQRPVKIGVLTDMTSIYAEHAGPGSVEAARMAPDLAVSTFAAMRRALRSPSESSAMLYGSQPDLLATNECPKLDFAYFMPRSKARR